MSFAPPSTARASTDSAPHILHLPDGGLVLCEYLLNKTSGQIRLSHMGNGQSITLSGVFAERLRRHLDAPHSAPFPMLGPLTRQYEWLNQLQAAGQTTAPTASDLLLGGGLGMLFIELTDRCNERCIHCYAESSPERSARLSRDEIRRVLEGARTLGRPAVQFTGGDPLLHPDLCFAVQTARAQGYKTLEIYTNGLALSKSLLHQLQPHRPSFAFSIYAHDAAVHDSITQTPGSLSRTLKAMRRVLAAELPLRVGIILMAENRGMEDATIAFLQQKLGLNAAQIGIDVVRSTGRGEFMQDYQPDAYRLKQFRHSPDSPQEKPQNGAASPLKKQKKERARRGKLCVSANGDVFPCIFSRRTTLGNIRKQSLTDILVSLNQRALSAPSADRWQQCRESLSCSDCQAIAFLLDNDRQDGQTVIPIEHGVANVAT